MLIFNKPTAIRKDQKTANQEITQDFAVTDIKITVQKSGHIADISRKIISNIFNCPISLYSNNSRLIVNSFTFHQHTVGVYFANSKSIPKLIADGNIDLAVVGSDQFFEYASKDQIQIIKKFDEHKWPLVLATPNGQNIKNVKDIKTIATQYPLITAQFIKENNLKNVKIVQTYGSTEAMCYTNKNGQKIDAIIDICVTGKTMTDNNMLCWTPNITTINPVLIANKKNYQNKKLAKILNLV